MRDLNKEFKRIQENLEKERKHLSDELELEVIPRAEGHQGSPLGKKDETAWESFESEKHRALAQNIQEQLTDVEYALNKLRKGTYGVCDSCGKPIPLARLEAIPRTNHCLGCKVN